MVTDQLFEKLSLLSRLQFDDKEKIIIKQDLEKMIRFIDKLNEIDTSAVKPLLHINEDVNIFREDQLQPMCSNEEALRNAPVKDETFFKVPKVIQNK